MDHTDPPAVRNRGGKHHEKSDHPGNAHRARACFSAAAESDYTWFPESEEFVGTWRSGDYTLLIVHMDDDYNLYNCIVTRMNGEHEGVRWIYDACSYDDIGCALSSLETGMKFTIVLDDAGELVSNEQVFTDGAAAFGFSDEGGLVWTDFKETPGEDEVVFERAMDESLLPAAFVGGWVSGRAALTIEATGDTFRCAVHWGGSATEAAEWVYDGCVYDAATGVLTAPDTGVRTNAVYGEGGEAVSEEILFEDGGATFVINGDGKLIWTDLKAEQGSGKTVFEKAGEAGA